MFAAVGDHALYGSAVLDSCPSMFVRHTARIWGQFFDLNMNTMKLLY